MENCLMNDGAKMTRYRVGGEVWDSIDLKMMLISRGVKVGARVYRAAADRWRFFPDPEKCNCVLLPDGTVVQLTDLQLHLGYLRRALSWDSLKQIKYFSQMNTPFRLDLDSEGTPTLFHGEQPISAVSFPPPTDFYRQKTMTGLPFLGNAVIQGTRWLAFQCLWPCDYACAGRSCQFCYSGGVHQSLAARGKPLPAVPMANDVADIVRYAFVESAYCDSMQLTGGSSFDALAESRRITEYLQAIAATLGQRQRGEILLYITPPEDPAIARDYFQLGADRVACSLEVWDEALARQITPGKMTFTTRRRHLQALEHIAQTYGPGKAFSNFIIGLEPFESLAQGAQYLAERGILPSASVWIPFGRPVMGSMAVPGLDYYRRVKRLLAELYTRYGLEPAGANGINVCVERDVWLHREEILGGDP